MTIESIPTRGLLSNVLFLWPLGAIGYLPLAAAVLALARPGRRPWTWAEWAGLGLSSGFMALVLSHNVARAYLERGPGLSAQDLGRWVIQPVASLAVALAIAHLFGPAWRRWTGPDARAIASGHGAE